LSLRILPHPEQEGRVQPDGRAAGDARTGGVAGSIDPLIGRLLDGRYEISGRIARGGMASVYEATDIRLDRTVAIKVMHAGLGDDDDFAARFVREARAAARLSHPNVVAVYDQGDDAGTVFLAMELIAGHTLRDTIAKESPMSPARALALLEPVLSALATAHRAGLIHRDVKPENVLIADDGRIKVADFGLAKAVSADTQHTATKGVLIGTVSYLAPELVVEGRADARADVYAAGVLLYELLTGKKPHEGETPIQVAYKHVHNDVPAPSELVPDLPEYVDALVARATARDRGLRPADAGVLLHQVHRVSHALDNGVRHDPDLTQDLAPTLLAGVAPGDTSPEMWDEAEMEALLAPPAPSPPSQQRPHAEHTSAYPATMPTPASPPPHAGPGHQAPGPARPRRSKRGPLLLVLALVLAVACGLGAYWLGWARYTTTPGVILMTQTEAEQKLEAAGLEVDYADEAFSETVPQGQVIETDPAAGSRILDNGTVTVTMSKGAERYEVPEVKGMSEDQAQDALLGLKLSFDESIGRYSEKIEKGTVIGSQPKTGTVLRPGASVDLIVSKGRRPIKVPDNRVGKSADDLIAELEDRGLVGTVVAEEFSDTIDEGDVISYQPDDGTLFRGGEVEITVSKGPALIEVPSVVGSGVRDAQDELEDAGFEVDVREDDDFISIGFVVRQDPGGGDLAPRGSTITIYVV
jgi:serine/threonine protein kinase/beta-lactam-binding protein with PASTA domain